MPLTVRRRLQVRFDADSTAFRLPVDDCCAKKIIDLSIFRRIQVVEWSYRPRLLQMSQQGLKWAGTHGNAAPRPAISGIWRSEASKSDLFLRGEIVLSIGTQLVNLNLVKITAWLEIQGAWLQNWKGPADFTGVQGFFYCSRYLKIID